MSSNYLLLGPEVGNKGQKLKEIRSSLNKKHNVEVELERYYPFETLNGEMIASLSSNSLFSDYRMVILSQAEQLNSEQTKDIAEYLKAPNPNVTLIIISNNTYIDNRIAKLIPKENTEIFWELFDNQKSQWLKSYFTKADLAITDDAIELLLALVENNTQQLRVVSNQLVQFALSDNKNTITDSLIETYIQHTKQESVFSLFEQICIGTYQRALSILHTLLDSKEFDAISLIGGLLWQFRRLISIQEAFEESNNWDSAVKAAQVMGKSSPLKRKKDIENYQKGSKRYPLKTTRKIIGRLGEFDIKVRQYSNDFHTLLMEQLLGIIMEGEGNAPAKLQVLSFSKDLRF